MVTYIATVWAKPGHETDVTRFYQDLEPLMRGAKGFRGRRIMRACAETMASAVRRTKPADAPAGGHAEPPAPAGTHFVLIEQWDSVDERIAFSRETSAGRSKDLMPHILPAHSHEFYEDVTPG